MPAPSDPSTPSDGSERSDPSDKKPREEPFLLPHGGYENLRSYVVAEAVYDATVVFCNRFIDKSSRTHDQMIQAARSGVRNISEGSGAAATSRKTQSSHQVTNRIRRHLRRQWLLLNTKRVHRRRVKRCRASGKPRKAGPNPFIPIVKPAKRRFRIQFPRALDVLNQPEEMIAFLDQIRHCALNRRAESIHVDHSSLTEITPEAVTVLMAEFHRITHLSPMLKLQTNPGSIRDEVREVLWQTGYLKHFNISWQSTTPQDKIILQHETAARAIPERAGKLVEHFARDPSFPKDATKSIGVALNECMENSVLHAYPLGLEGAFLKRQWWLLGMRCPKSHEFFFVFYDQGIGIPKTIRTRLRDRSRIPFLSRSNQELVRLAIEDGAFSSTKDPHRGKGLRTLKSIVEKAQSGELVVITGSVRLCYQHGGGFESMRLRRNLGGTLIFWRIQS
jgi:hypothetical protein